jgi:hypothetical protein
MPAVAKRTVMKSLTGFFHFRPSFEGQISEENHAPGLLSVSACRFNPIGSK